MGAKARHRIGRTRFHRLVCNTVLAASLVTAAAHSALAQDNFPAKPVRLIVPYGPGGPTDLTARIVADALDDTLGVPIVVENKPGASTQIGTEELSRAEPDGYTIMIATISTALLPQTNAGFSLDLRKAWEPISQLVGAPTVISVTSSLPVETMEEFVAYAKKNPGVLNFGGQGAGDVLASELFDSLAGTDTVPIRYSGGGEAMQALLKGEVHFLVAFPGVIKPYVDAGSAKALAVTSLERYSGWKDLPTVDEAGVTGFEYVGWSGLVAPAGTPAAVIEKLNKATAEALQNPRVQKRLADLGYEVIPSSAQDFKTLISNEMTKWEKVAADAGIEPQ